MIKRLLLLLLLVIAGIAGYVWYKFSTEKSGGFEGEKAAKLEIKSSTPLFDNGLQQILSAYQATKEAFVNADTAAVKAAAAKVVSSIDSLKLDEIKNDTTGIATTVETFLGDVKSHFVKIGTSATINDMRLSFYDASQQLYPLLKSIKYKGTKLYWQNCPMAFDGDKEAYWLDTQSGDEKMNPYLGKNHPKFGSSMLHCGEEKDSVIAK